MNRLRLVSFSALFVATACSGSVDDTLFTGAASSSSGASPSATGSTVTTSGTGGASATSTTTDVGGAKSTGSITTTSTSSGCNSGPDEDADGDGFTVAGGDCNDCDPNVNPGAIDLGNNEDCDPTTSAAAPCDSGLTVDGDATSAAKAIELCQTATPADKKWGVLSAAYVRADGTPAMIDSTAPQTGIEPSFGDNVHPQGGAQMLVLSSGTARTPTQAGACGAESCMHTNPNGTPPPGFPSPSPACDMMPPATQIVDDIALALAIRTPTNATGYALDFKYYTFEFPGFACSAYTDQFVALASPPPAGAMDGNLVFDAMMNPISANTPLITVCDPDAMGSYTGPNVPNPYCPSGTLELLGTGFDVWANATPPIMAGATSWLEVSAPVTGGEELDLRLTIWNGGDEQLFSSVLLDNWKWITNNGTVTLETNTIANPL